MQLAGKSLRRAPWLALSVAAALCCLVLAAPAVADGPPPIPDLASLTFEPNPIAPNAVTTGTITLTGPAPPGGLTISLSVTPASAAIVPASVAVPATESSAQFSATDLGMTSSWTVTAAMFADTESDTVYIGTPANASPTLDPIGPKTVQAGEPLIFTVSGSDPDAADAPLLAYSASNLPPGATFDSATRQFSWTPSTDQVGAHPGVHFEVTDGKATDSEDVTITVAAPPAGSPPASAPTLPESPPVPPVLAAGVPATKMGKLKIDKRKRSVTFRFSADTRGATFMCSLDKKKFAPCRSPKTYKHLKRGRHTFRVKARNGAGTDPTPAAKKFRL